jgi:hypothetical protein
MNKLTNSEIWERVQNDNKDLLKYYSSNLILGTFVLGKANFGKASDSKDITTVSIIFPTIENLATNGGYIRHGSYNKQGGRIEHIDFRDLFDYFNKCEENYSEILFTEFFVINPMYKKTFEKIQFKLNLSYEQRREAILQFEMADNTEMLAEGLTNLFSQYLSFRDGVQEQLFTALTKTEEKALIFVLETIGEEGNISISEAINRSGISRPVFTSLFDKLDRYKGAEIKNQGVKGTYINFFDHVLSKFEIS